MEHIVQFAVGIDDDAIVKKIEEYAVKTITTELKQSVADKIFEPCYYISKHARPNDDPLSKFSANIVSQFLDENKETIIEKASSMLADKMFKSKTVREKMLDKSSEM